MTIHEGGLPVVDTDETHFHTPAWLQSELKLLATAPKPEEKDWYVFQREQSIEAIQRILTFLELNGLAAAHLIPVRRAARALWEVQYGGKPDFLQALQGSKGHAHSAYSATLVDKVREHVQLLVHLGMVPGAAKAKVLSMLVAAEVPNGAGKIGLEGVRAIVSKRNVDEWWRARFDCTRWKAFRAELIADVGPVPAFPRDIDTAISEIEWNVTNYSQPSF